MSKVTIVIPNFNGKEYMDKCLVCLKNQIYKEFDVIVIDNASKDESQKIPYNYSEFFVSIFDSFCSRASPTLCFAIS